MKKYILAPFILISSITKAQAPEDVLRYSFNPQSGTARNMAIGGAMGSLGGDINATYVNPAGIANFKTGEFVFTPQFFLNNNSIDFRDINNKSKKNNLTFSQIGVVFGAAKRYQPTVNHSVSLAVSQTANYNNNSYYSGLNNYSSFSEQWAEEVAKSGLSLNQIRNTTQYAYGSAPALETYLVDTFNIGGNLVVKALPEFILESGKALRQEMWKNTSGGIYEIALGYAVNNNDKIQFGGSLGIPILNYKSNVTFKESDTSNDAGNNFSSFTYTDNMRTSGVGANLKMGLIYRPKQYIRLGVALHSPTYMFSMTDKRSTTLTANTEDYNNTAFTTSETFLNGVPNNNNYTMLTPWKFIVSGSYVFREIENVRKQRAFITADIEYLRHRASSFYSASEVPDPAEKNYYKSLNKVIKSEYKSSFNFRVGGEVKFNVIMARVGFAYYSNPYKDKALKANKMLLSGGIGYRNKGFFIDLTYVHAFNKDVNFPYRLADKANTFATEKNQRGNIVASVGFKF